MPRAEQLRRMREVRDFFRERIAPNVDSPQEARAEMTKRFSLTDQEWYRVVPKLKDIISDTRKSGVEQGRIVEEVIPQEPPAETAHPGEELIEVPADLSPEAREVVNRLLLKNQELAGALQSREAEMAVQRGQIVAMTKRISLLKKIHYDAVEAL